MSRDKKILSVTLAAGLLLTSLALTQAPHSTSAAAGPASTPANQKQSLTQVSQAPSPQNPYLEDSEALHQMALELKQQVDKSTKDQLSLDVIRKADGIEKLAHSLKQRIRSDGGLP